jgi:hypothetical protein
MSKPDKALLWAREKRAQFWEGLSSVQDADRAVHAANARSGASDDDLEEEVTGRLNWLEGYRAGQAASAERIKALKEALKDSVTAMRLLLDAVQKHNAESDTFLSGFPLHLLTIEIAAAENLLKEADQ